MTTGKSIFKARQECNGSIPSILAPTDYDVDKAAADCSDVEDGVLKLMNTPTLNIYKELSGYAKVPACSLFST